MEQTQNIKNESQQEQDIVPLILKDHKDLKELIKVMKDTEQYSLSERQNAFEEFAPLLICHAKPEEQTLYIYLKGEEDLREEGFEGEVEHTLADQLLEETRRTDDEDLWSARVKVLAELVEHHIDEEEKSILPDFKQASGPEDRQQLAKNFLMLKEKFVAMGGKDSPSEVTMSQGRQAYGPH